MEKKNIKVLPVKRFNLVHLIFIILVIYMAITLARYITKEDVKITEISEGTLTQNHIYNGLAIREEQLFYADKSGYLTCFTNDNERIAKKKVMYVVDRTGKALKASTEYKKELSDMQLNSLRKSFNYFSTTYNGQDFGQVYEFKNRLTSMIFDIEQTSAKNLKSNKKLSVERSKKSGLVFFTLDGLEKISENAISRSYLEEVEQNNHRLNTGDYVEENTPVCKMITSESWDILIPITEEDAEYYRNESKATVRFTDTDKTCSAHIELFQDAEGKTIARLSLNTFMASYAAERIVSIQLVKKLDNGLKVPKSSVVSRELYIVPVEYGIKDENNNIYFWAKTENGMERIEPSISYADKYYYYLDESQIEDQTELTWLPTNKDGEDEADLKDSSYVISEKESLKGVYNVNKGYALFEVVEILDENDAYCIVKGGTRYGLAVYDHIVLNAASVKEDDLLY